MERERGRDKFALQSAVKFDEPSARDEGQFGRFSISTFGSALLCFQKALTTQLLNMAIKHRRVHDSLAVKHYEQYSVDGSLLIQLSSDIVP